MSQATVRRSFFLLHLTVALVVFYQSIDTVYRAVVGHSFGENNLHVTLLASVEAIAAVLFLIPKTLKLGGGILLVIFGIALVVHGVRAEMPLLVYAAAVLFIVVRGSERL